MPDKIDVARLAREAEEYAQRNGSSDWSHYAMFNEHFARLVMEECAKVVEARAGIGAYAESMGAHRILTSAADAIRDQKP